MTDQDKADKAKAQIERINELSQLARAAWFALLAYLVFVGITLLGVEDADFFVPSRQTQLPLVNVQIPTASFFWTAPILGAALYTYLHLFLIKLWHAHGEAKSSDADPTHHWLVNDFVLIQQGDPTARSRPLAWLTNWITRLLVWVAGPAVLGYAWLRSLPAHYPLLSLTIAACFLLTVHIAFVSWRYAVIQLDAAHADPHRWWRRRDPWYIGILLTCVTLLSTTFPLVLGPFFSTSPFALRPISTLSSANLDGFELVPLPDGWRSPETARHAFRDTWCDREGLDMLVCDHPPNADRAPPPNLASDRLAWCKDHGGLDQDACQEHFANLDRRFGLAWDEERTSTIENLNPLILLGSDLRNASAFRASLVGANLGEARLEGANLGEARLEGANLGLARLEGANLGLARLEGANLGLARLEGASLWEARLEGADLGGARLEGANLWEARLEGANLGLARLEGANLWEARLEGANLWEARLEGANLGGARLEGANLWEARLEGANLWEARLEGADLRYADFRKSNWAGASNRASPAQFADFRAGQDLTQAQLDNLIGNRETLLPDTPAPDTKQPFHVWSCWANPPEGFDALVERVARTSGDDAETIRADFLCPEGEAPQKTGTPLVVDAPYPEGHPLADRD